MHPVGTRKWALGAITLAVLAVSLDITVSVFAGDAVAKKLHSPAFLASVHQAFIHGMDAALLVSAISAALAMVRALAFLPGAPLSQSRSANRPELKLDALPETKLGLRERKEVRTRALIQTPRNRFSRPGFQ